MNWNFDSDLKSEQENTLLLLDQQFESYPVRPVFKILGGTALLLHGIEHIVTIDIDIANKMDDKVRAIVEPFISDNASEVATLAKNYDTRLVEYKPDLFKNIGVYLLSKEDLVITKLGAGRYKDIEDLTRTSILRDIDINKTMEIINTEFPTTVASKLLTQFLRVQDMM